MRLSIQIGNFFLLVSNPKFEKKLFAWQFLLVVPILKHTSLIWSSKKSFEDTAWMKLSIKKRNLFPFIIKAKSLKKKFLYDNFYLLHQYSNTLA
jgi:hypothetical protein